VGILDDDVIRVRDATDLVALASEHLALKRSGSRYVGLCPFHAEKTPSFSINPDMGRYHCFAGETLVMTWEGSRPIRELAGTTQRVLSTNGRWIDAPFHSFGVQPLRKVTVGRNRVIKEIYATPEHRWFVRTDRGLRGERTTDELRSGDPLSWTFPQRRLATGVTLSPLGVAHGIAYGDGTRSRTGATVDLDGEKDAELVKWFPLSRVSNSRRVSARGAQRSYLKVLDLPGCFKERPSLDESSAYLLGWLAGYFAADGCVAKDGTVILNSASRRDLEFVRTLCTRVGIGTYGITEQMRTGFPGRPASRLFRIHFINEDLSDDFFLLSEHRARFARTTKSWTRRGWVVRSVESTERVEEVFCAVVPEEHAFALEDNILTGNCFGCQASGDAITFVREVEHLDFVDAVERLAARAGITIRYDDKAIGQDRSKKQRLSEAVAAAIAFYHRLLLESSEGGLARRYLRSRGFDGDAARRFQIGWSPDDFDQLSHHLQQAKFARADIVDAGLAFVNKVNKLQDQFRARLMFPIYDSRGEAVGFGGRALGDTGPKYKNSPETPIYQKSRLLYGLNWAKAEIVARGEVVICEGYTDVMAFALAGAPNAVATCGTALADDHFQILKNLARKVVLAYDSDAAGQGAAEKWYGWEQRYEIQLQVADLPAGRDPADVWHDDPAQLLVAIERAAPFLQFRIDRVLGAADLATLEGRARAAEIAAAIVAQHPSDLVRDQYVMKLSGTLDIDADRLRDAVARAPRDAAGPAKTAPGAVTRQRPPPSTRPVRVDRRELDVLLYAVHDPELVVDWLDARLFSDPVARAAFTQIAESADFHDAMEGAEGPVRDLLERIAVEEPIASDEPETLRAHLMANMIGPAAQRELAGMLRGGDERATSVKLLLDALAHAREMGDWLAVQEDASQLLGWIGEGSRGPTSA
jgi:DNA primase